MEDKVGRLSNESPSRVPVALDLHSSLLHASNKSTTVKATRSLTTRATPPHRSTGCGCAHGKRGLSSVFTLGSGETRAGHGGRAVLGSPADRLERAPNDPTPHGRPSRRIAPRSHPKGTYRMGCAAWLPGVCAGGQAAQCEQTQCRHKRSLWAHS